MTREAQIRAAIERELRRWGRPELAERVPGRCQRHGGGRRPGSKARREDERQAHRPQRGRAEHLDPVTCGAGGTARPERALIRLLTIREDREHHDTGNGTRDQHWRGRTHDNGRKMYDADGTMLDAHGQWSIFDDVDE